MNANENKKTKTNVKKIIRYPKETTIIGDKVFFDVFIPKKANMSDEEREKLIVEKESELASQVKILFVATDND